MKIMRVLGCGLVLAGMLAAAVAQEEAASGAGDEASARWLEGSVELGFLTGYLWHGMLINDEPVAQPSLTLESYGFGFNVWGNYDFTDNYSEEAPAFTEVDYTLSYSFDLAPFAFSAGFSLYDYPNTFEEEELEDGTIARSRPENTRLVYGYAEMPDLAVVPSLTVEYGVDGDEALYSALGLAYERAIAATLTVELTGSLAWANAAYHRSQFDAEEYAMGDATLGASLIWSPSEPFSITASLLYSTFVSETISDAAEASGYDAPDAMVAGLTVGYAF